MERLERKKVEKVSSGDVEFDNAINKFLPKKASRFNTNLKIDFKRVDSPELIEELKNATIISRFNSVTDL